MSVNEPKNTQGASANAAISTAPLSNNGKHPLLQAVEQPERNHPKVEAGDTVKVHVRVVEGDKERVQIFQGVVIRYRGGGNDENFTVRRIATHGVGVERTFLLKSPRVDKIEVVRHAKVRRAQLYYLRDAKGKAARLKERR
ncbi:MAG: 50S ribosomal protein L19 [Chloroflexota bacterium]|nr:50S ribosomal protein L19 [Chloroflexota bacterium]